MSFRKRLENFWFYYKIPVIVVTIAAAVVLYDFIQQLSAEQVDFSVGVIDAAYHDSEQCAQLQAVLEQNCGKRVEIRTYRLTLGAYGQDDSTIGRLDADLSNTLSGLLLIEDPDAFRECVSYAADAVISLQVRDTSLAGLGFDELYVFYAPGCEEEYSVLLA